ncbi:Flagellar protein (FlbD) [Posidoniimonas polymericola]|uniref:Flagellar protein (FlbD) n=1 Tax=Posidoniimonas polymericola TaxID=2528002 RepID=A0A5C5YQN2_9BACT|nr:flagellar FlbD family protein [Posidoniimonas polymericola]TWT77225.1 Flagellar protein (FlbD) [Posidoniimonas polymericola]
MIKLTRLSGEPFILNAELIKYVEKCPDTILTLTTGDHIVVGETPEQVLRAAVEYQQSKNLIPGAQAALGCGVAKSTTPKHTATT